MAVDILTHSLPIFHATDVELYHICLLNCSRPQKWPDNSSACLRTSYRRNTHDDCNQARDNRHQGLQTKKQTNKHKYIRASLSNIKNNILKKVDLFFFTVHVSVFCDLVFTGQKKVQSPPLVLELFQWTYCSYFITVS